jgi:hypothetical protein
MDRGRQEEAMKRNVLFAGAMAVLIVAVAGGGYWWSHRASFEYQGLAGRFPSKVEAFVELSQLGQWMPPPEGKSAAAPAASPARGTDPMLQVLQTVWAAPPVTPKDLPDILRTKPMAAGFWLEGKVLKGAALMPLAPGERTAVERVIHEKMGDGPVVETVAGIEFRKIDFPRDKVEISLDQVLWGVGDQWVVIAVGLDGAKTVLAAPASPLSADPVFLSVQRKFASHDGASLFVRGALMEQAVKLGADHSEADSPVAKPAADLHPAPAVPGSEDQEKPESGLGDQVTKALMKGGLAKFLSMESLSALAIWTAPPKEGEKGWQVQSWMAIKDQPKGVWRLATQGTARTPQIAGRLPKRGQTYVWGSGRDPARLYQDILEELSRDLPPDQMSWVRAGIGAAEGKVELSFANDLLPALSDEWCFASESKSPPSQEGATDGASSKAAFFIILRDPRRFEDLVTQKLAPQLKLKALDLKGARAWSMGEGSEAVSLVVSGGMAILTNNPAWALDTGGSPGKSWEALADYKDKACMLAVADTSRPSQPADVLMKFECQCGPQGILVKGRFPGQAPGWFKDGPGCKKPCDKPCTESGEPEGKASIHSPGEAKGSI